MPSAKTRKKSAGFTLMEMLLVSALMPVIIFAVFANMSSGMRVWKAFNRPVMQEETVIFIDRLRADFSGAFPFGSIPFSGETGGVTFAATVTADARLGGERGIGRVAYRYDESRNVIVRDESDYSELYKSSPPRSKVVLAGVSEFRAEYLAYAQEESAWTWRDEWQPLPKKPLPAAVRVTVARPGETLVKTFTVPCGN